MSLFTPVQGLAGGGLIGGSASVLLVMNGDIMGFSGILHNVLGSPVQALQNPKVIACRDVSCWSFVFISHGHFFYRITGAMSTWRVLPSPSMSLSIIWHPRNLWPTIDRKTVMFPSLLLGPTCWVDSLLGLEPNLEMDAHQVWTRPIGHFRQILIERGISNHFIFTF